MSFIYSILTPFPKIGYYLSRLSGAFNGTVVKYYILFSFIEKYVILKVKKES